MHGDLFVRLLLLGSLVTIAACANSDRGAPKSGQTHANQQNLMINTGAGAGGGGGY